MTWLSTSRSSASTAGSCSTAWDAAALSWWITAAAAAATCASTRPPISVMRSRRFAEFLRVGADDVVGLLVGHDGAPQPNRPVMYSWVRFCLGAVNIWTAGATSTSSPR